MSRIQKDEREEQVCGRRRKLLEDHYQGERRTGKTAGVDSPAIDGVVPRHLSLHELEERPIQTRRSPMDRDRLR